MALIHHSDLTADLPVADADAGHPRVKGAHEQPDSAVRPPE
jgi:hypothetical protein